MAFQQDLPKFEAANAQVLGVSVDFNDANKAWAKQLGLTYPLLSDVRREMSRAYAVLADDLAMKDDPKRVPLFMRSQRAWIIIDKEGTIRYSRLSEPREFVSNDELLQVLKTLP